MAFSNPFNKFFKNKKAETKDTGDHSKLVKDVMDKDFVPATQKIKGLFKGMRQRRADVEGFARKFEDIKRLPDPGARLIEFKNLQDSCVKKLAKITGTTLPAGIGTSLGGVAMTFAGLSILNPMLFFGGLFVMGAGGGIVARGSAPSKSTLSPALRKDYAALESLIEKTTVSINDIVSDEPLLNIAKSPFFDRATVAFPALKDRFLTAAIRENLLRDGLQKPVNEPNNDRPGPKF